MKIEEYAMATLASGNEYEKVVFLTYFPPTHPSFTLTVKFLYSLASHRWENGACFGIEDGEFEDEEVGRIHAIAAKSFEDTFAKIGAFYEKVHHLLQKEEFAVEPLSVEVKKDGFVLFQVFALCLEEDFELILNIGYDRKIFNFGFVDKKDESGDTAINFSHGHLYPDSGVAFYQGIESVRRWLVEESELRLKVLMAEDELDS